MSSASKYDKRKTGDPGTRDFRVYITADGNLVSPWHEIPLFASDEPGLVNMVVEIPRWSNTKMEVGSSITLKNGHGERPLQTLTD